MPEGDDVAVLFEPNAPVLFVIVNIYQTLFFKKRRRTRVLRAPTSRRVKLLALKAAAAKPARESKQNDFIASWDVQLM